MASQEVGVYYARPDYVGFFRRMLIDFVDGVVLLVASYCASVVINAAVDSRDSALQIIIVAILVISFLYLVLLKHWARTLGYFLLGAQLVNMAGHKPSMPSLIVRSLFLFIGPGNTLLDLVCLTSDPDRQAIRYKFARTYVIRRGAKPIGEGPVRYMRMGLLGYHFVVPEVKRTVPIPASSISSA